MDLITEDIEDDIQKDIQSSQYLKSKDFIYGVSISAAQNEGAIESRSESVWDAFASIPGNIRDGSNGSVACDFYNNPQRDIQLMKKIGLKHFRLSISWARIIKQNNEINQEGIDYYNNLFNELIENGITPCVTLNHWDMPLFLYQEYGGWMSRRAVKDFLFYAKLCFRNFPQVKFWITHNEPWCVMISYTTGDQAPGYRERPGHAPYIVAHHLLLSHAYVVKHYRKHYQSVENVNRDNGGKIGICLNTNWWQSVTSHPADVEAAKRAMQFMFGLFYEPLMLGDYPQVVREIVGDRLPKFTEKEKEIVKGSIDFTGLNYYTSLYCGQTTFTRFVANVYRFLGMRDFFAIMFKKHYYSDMNVMAFKEPGEVTSTGWGIHPAGLYQLIKYCYDNYEVKGGIYIFENGMATEDDEKRIHFIRDHLYEIYRANKDGYDVRGYYYWTWTSNWEWQLGYTVDFGLVSCDVHTQERKLKKSAYYYSMYSQGILESNIENENLENIEEKEEFRGKYNDKGKDKSKGKEEI